jgi:serine/threonine protein phosphatase 1
VIGDVHGCAASLGALLARLPADDHLIFCGDVINRGPAIEQAMERVWELVQQGRATWLMGNHEWALVQALRSGLPGPVLALSHAETLRQLGERRCRAWLDRLQQLPLAYWGEGWVATHAGFDLTTWEPDLTIRQSFWRDYDGRFGEVIVGHTPDQSLRRYRSVVIVDTGACYGGPLTAYCPETREVRQVPGVRSPQPDPTVFRPRLHAAGPV